MAKTSQEKSMERMSTFPGGWETQEHGLLWEHVNLVICYPQTRNYMEKPLTIKTRVSWWQ
ncbi:hypothetical protein CsSME_00053171 [Camellia sinensis var. sinensis]